MATTLTHARKKPFPFTRSFADNILTGPPRLPATITRKSADALTAAEQQTFKSAVARAIADGIYTTLVGIHSDMQHDMHTMPDMPTGTQRFLPWHREFLINFEQVMRRFEPAFTVPYWRWMDANSIPAWMTGFKPSGVYDANGKPIVIKRNPGGLPEARTLPTSQIIKSTVMSATEYTTFTLALEGAQPYGAHNQVHVWFDGTMTYIPTAPADPMFWMLHAEVDRIWWIWQQSHPGQNPTLAGADDVLDPWPEHVADVLNIAAGNHPYTYDRSVL
jgi:tyrosinase